MESGTITSWQIEEQKMETVTDFLFLGFKNYCGCWLQPWNSEMFAPWKKSYENIDSILKSRNVTLPTKVHIVKAMVFPVVRYRYQSWTIRKADCQRTDVLKSWCRRRLLRVPGQQDQTKQPWRKSTLNILWKDCCWSWCSNTLAAWC